MKTITEEQFKKQYGERQLMKVQEASQNQAPPAKGGRPLSNRFTEAVGLGGATDVFGRLMARQGIGTDTPKEVTQEFIEAPTGKEIAGAVAQTATIPLGAAITGGGSLAGQVAAGAGLGYIYDVGADFASGVQGAEAFKPGAETLAGAAIPVALRGAGAALRGAGPLIANKTLGLREGVSNTLSALPNTGIGQRASEFAQRFPRAMRRVGEYVDEGAEIAQRKQTGSPAVVNALDEGIPLETVDFVQELDTPTRKAAQEMLDLADGGRGSALPQTVPGRIAGEQFDIIETQRRNIGEQIGEFSDSLPTQKIDVTPSIQQLNDTLAQNGIIARNGELIFDDPGLTRQQRGLLQEMYNEAVMRTEMSPRQIHKIDQLFSKLQREARFSGVEDVRISVQTPEGTTEVPVQKVFRDVFGQKLDEIAEQAGRGDIRELNRDYRSLRNLQDNVESTIVRQSRLEGIDVDPAESASVALRRLFSNATSRAEYQEVYDQLDAMSRSLGYDGARADTLMDFYLTDVKPIYPDTVPKASFEGGIRGAIGNVIERISEVGSPNVKDQQKALRELLESVEDANPQSFNQGVTPQTKTGLTPEQGTALRGLGERLNESSANNTPKYLQDNKQAGFANFGSIIPERITPNSVAAKMDAQDFDAIAVVLDDVATARQNPAVNRLLDDMKIGKASNDDVEAFLRRTSDEYEKLNPPKAATPETTDLLSQAKGKTLDVDQ